VGEEDPEGLTMERVAQLFANNRAWAARLAREQPGLLARLARQQDPHYLWIGCSDSRVPANEIVGLLPGELFVHRNVANLVVHTDFNCLSVLHYAIEVLKVQDVIVCGHYGCGGVAAAIQARPLGFIDNWLRHIRDTYDRHREELDALAEDDLRVDRLCELNVRVQVRNICRTSFVQEAWRRGETLAVHGWIYSVSDGLLRDLEVTAGSPSEVPS
jgi:carbonic anhydrase